jgi:hypothetical protein
MAIDRGEELLLQRQILGERFEDQIGFGDRFGEIVLVGSKADEVGELLRLRHRLRTLEPLSGLLVIASEKDGLDAVGRDHVTAPRPHRAVGAEDGDVADLSRRGGHRPVSGS